MPRVGPPLTRDGTIKWEERGQPLTATMKTIRSVTSLERAQAPPSVQEAPAPVLERRPSLKEFVAGAVPPLPIGGEAGMGGGFEGKGTVDGTALSANAAVGAV